MVNVDRIKAILSAHNLTPTALGRLINVSQPKMSKVMNGTQSLPAEAIGELIKTFKIHPNWIFGYEGDANEVMYMGDLVHKSEVERKETEILELERENATLYKKLNQQLERQVAEEQAKYKGQSAREGIKNT
jgi:transcriptional regulator with XRE-family HTH domain